MDPRTARVAALFDRAAPTYDAVDVPWFGPIAEQLVRALDPQPGEHVLDVGCGRGAVLARAADAVGAGGRAVGFDVAPEMVRRTAADLAGNPAVEVLVADAAAPGLDGRTFDVVAASLVLFFLPDPAVALAAWRPLLRPGGRLGVTTFAAQQPEWESVDDLFTPWLPPQLLDARASGRRGPFADDAGVEGLLRDAGLEGVSTRRQRHTAVFAQVEDWVSWSRSHGQRGMWDLVPAEEHPALVERAAAVLDGCRDAQGRIALWQDVRATLGRAPS